MTVLTFPSNPIVGQQYAAPNGIQYVFDGVKWIVETTTSSSEAVSNSTQDRVAPMFVDGTHDGITFTYNAATNVMSAEVTAVNGDTLVNGVHEFTLESNGTVTLDGDPFTSFSGDYADLSGTPTIPSAQIQSDWNQASNVTLDFIKNKPTIPPAYTLPTATTSVLGGVKVDGTTVTITDGVISSVGGSGAADPNIWIQTFETVDGAPIDVVGIAISVEYDAAGNVISLFTHSNDNDNNSYYSVGKYTTTGTKIWTARFEDGFQTDGWGLAVDNDSNSIYVAGQTLVSNESGYDVSTLTKLDSSDGSIEWSKVYDFGFTSQSAVVDVDSDGNPVMVGYANNGTDNYITTTKVDPADGTIIWSRALNGQGDEEAFGMAVGPTGEVVAVGYMSQLGVQDAAATLAVDPPSNPLWTVSGSINFGGITADFTFTDGVPTFTNVVDTVGGRSVETVIVAVLGDDLGGVTGFDDMIVKVATLAANDTDDRMLVVKYDSTGTIQWQKAIQFDAGFDCRGADADIDSDGNIYVTGSYQYSFESGTTSALSILKLDSTGVKQWSRRVTGNCETFGVSVVVGADDKLYLSGVTGNNDANNAFTWVAAKYGIDGTVEWQRLIDNTTGWSFTGGIFFGEGGGSNIAVKDGYVVLGGGFGLLIEDLARATLVQVAATGDAFSVGDWDFKAASFSGVLNSSASDITVVNAGKTDIDNVSNINVSTVTLQFDSSAFLIGTLYSAGDSSDRLVNGEYEVVLGSTGTVTLPAGGTITEGVITSNPTIQLTPATPDVASQKLVIKGGGTVDYHLHLTTGDLTETSIFLGTDDHNVRTTVNGGIEINTPSEGIPSGISSIGSTTSFWDLNPLSNLATTGGSGTGLTVTVTQTEGVAVAIAIVNPGSGYTNNDLITVTSGGANAMFFINAIGNSRWNFDANGNLTLPAGGVISETPETALNIATSPTTTYTFSQAYWEALNGNASRMFTPTGNAQYFSCIITSQQDGSYTVDITGTGNTFVPGNWFKVPGDELGGSAPANDIQITVATVGGGEILTVTVIGTAVGKQWTFSTDGSLEFPAGYILPNTIGSPGQTLIAGGQGSVSWANLPSTGDLVSTTTASITTASNPNNGPFGGMVSANLEGDGIVVFGPAGGTSEPDELAGVDLTRLVGGTITESGSGLSSPILSVTSLGNKLYSIQVEGVLATVTGGEGIGLTITVDPLSEKIWTFGTDGTITFPDGTTNSGDTVISTSTYDIQSIGNTLIQTSANAGAKTWTFGTNGSLTFPDATVQTTALVQGEQVFTLDTGAIDYTPTAVDFNLLFVTPAIGYSGTDPTSVTLPNGVPGQRLVIFNGYNLATLTVNPGPFGRDISSGIVAEFIYSGFDGLWMPLYGTNSPT